MVDVRANTVNSRVHEGVNKRLQLVEEVSKGMAIVSINDNSMAIDATTTWYSDAVQRNAIGTTITKSSSDIDWITAHLAASGDQISDDTIALAPGNYKVTFQLSVLNNNAAITTAKFALTDDGPANDGVATVALFVTPEPGCPISDGVNSSMFYTKSFFINLGTADAEIDLDAAGAVEVTGSHLLYFCAAVEANGAALDLLQSDIVIERLG